MFHRGRKWRTLRSQETFAFTGRSHLMEWSNSAGGRAKGARVASLGPALTSLLRSKRNFGQRGAAAKPWVRHSRKEKTISFNGNAGGWGRVEWLERVITTAYEKADGPMTGRFKCFIRTILCRTYRCSTKLCWCEKYNPPWGQKLANRENKL